MYRASAGSDDRSFQQLRLRSPSGVPLPLSKAHITALDGVRGFAVLQVMLAHFGAIARLSDSFAWKCATASIGFLPNGVELFFVLSGFLITGILLDAKGNRNYFTHFYARRSLRIFPLYYGVLAVFFGIIALRVHFDHFADPNYLTLSHRQGWLWTYLTNFWCGLGGQAPGTQSFSLVHFWTLAAEEQFYLGWPLVVYLCKPRAVIGVCIGGLAAMAVLRLGLHYRHDENALFFLVRSDGLFAGALLACLVRTAWKPSRGFRAARTAVFILAVLTPLFTAASLLITLAPRLQAPLGLLKTLAPMHAVAIYFAMMVMCLGACPSHPLRRCLESPFLTYFGKLSYGLYVYHFFFIGAMREYVLRGLICRFTTGLLAVPLFMLTCTLISFALAWLSWHLYEKWFLKMKRFVPL